jgi:periplasmic divalent cation tolerance protein
VNVIDGMKSMYRWQGEVAEAQETVLIAKTRAALVDKVTDLVTDLHSYDCPCVVALPVTGGNPDFLQWIAAETSDQLSESP